MKQKPHHKKGAIQQHFSEFRDRLFTPKNQPGDVQYEVRRKKGSFSVVIHRERGANQTLHFENEKALDEYLHSIS